MRCYDFRKHLSSSHSVISSFPISVFTSPAISDLRPVYRSLKRSLFPAVVIMTEANENFSTVSSPVAAAVATDGSVVNGEVVDVSTTFGFQRSEMYRENLAGTVDAYGRHVFLCYKTRESWPSRVENSESDPLPKLLSKALKARKDDITVKTRLTICEGREAGNLVDGDVLIFPEMIKYRGLKEIDVDAFVEDVLVNGKPWTSGVQEVLTGSHVFVCAHNSRDQRCGVCGPALIEKFKEKIQSRELGDQVFVTACSHVGGHKYAGNVIIFSSASDGRIGGHWYGYVTPNDVSELLDQHIGKGIVVNRLLRGQIGVHHEESEVAEQNLPNGNDITNAVENSEESTKERESVPGCCQGTSGFSCCQERTFEEKQCEKEEGSLSNWFGRWEQQEVVTAVAVVGAVATVAVAYSLYRRSR